MGLEYSPASGCPGCVGAGTFQRQTLRRAAAFCGVTAVARRVAELGVGPVRYMGQFWRSGGAARLGTLSAVLLRSAASTVDATILVCVVTAGAARDRTTGRSRGRGPGRTARWPGRARPQRTETRAR